MGITPLIYAACFGCVSIVELLLDAGAAVDGQDKMGWSPLMWATANNHKVIVELLLSHGASWANQTSSGRTFLDYADYNNEGLVHCLIPPDLVDDTDGKQHLFYDRLNQSKRRQQSNNVPKLGLNEHTAIHFQSTQQPQMETTNSISLLEPLHAETDEEWDELVSCEASMDSLHHFVWERCLPDQMFVFAEDDIAHILNVTISSLELPMKTRQEIWVPSNVLFLCARFAYYYSGRDLLTGILDGGITKIASMLHNNNGDIHTTAFWIANLSQLLYYLKKDTGLVVATAEQQLEISELISETYVLLVTDSEKRIAKILDASMLDHDLIGADPVDFADSWQRFFRRRGSSRRPSSMTSSVLSVSSSALDHMALMTSRPQEIYQEDSSTIQQQRRSVDLETNQPSAMPSSYMSSSCAPSASSASLSPHSITSLLSSILYVLQSYEVHPSIITQAMAQCFHFMSCEIFNQILTTKKYVCRSKAVQIRMNLSVIEDWVREQQPFLPVHLTSHFAPLIQLLQLLQCVSQLNELTTFVGTTIGFDLLNPLQIKRCVLNYRYEVDEPRLSDEVEKYTIQMAYDAMHRGTLQQTRESDVGGGGYIMELSASKRNSMKPFSRNMDSVQQQKPKQESPVGSNSNSRRQSQVSTRPTSISSLGSLIMSRLTNGSSALVDDRQQQQQKKTSNGLDETNQGSRYRWDDDDDVDNDDADKGDDNHSTTESEDDVHDDHEDGRGRLEEMRDSKYMLPFSLPTSTAMIHYASYQQQQLHIQFSLSQSQRHPQQHGDNVSDDNRSYNFGDYDYDDDDDGDGDTRQLVRNKKLYDLEMSQSIYEQVRQTKRAAEREKRSKERMVIPTISQNWMDRLDRCHEQETCLQTSDNHGTEAGIYHPHGTRRTLDVY
ncbi:hypothetical protein BCR42DRAFT_410851 [Absidia repens]|uniref:Dilute domain-containing protein n=1 Tax=Absidia repens TaxID=90262 RepID=A0A1X2IKX1_9FUNG|nr:hypothetical protein BCR42DRAFT_410851 [Absidia repens]